MLLLLLMVLAVFPLMMTAMIVVIVMMLLLVLLFLPRIHLVPSAIVSPTVRQRVVMVPARGMRVRIPVRLGVGVLL